MTPKQRSVVRWTVRLLCLAAAVGFAIGGPLPNALRGLTPGLSPLLLAIQTVTGRSWYAGLFWGLPAVAVLVLACMRGRFFCRWICPTGTLQSAAALVSVKKRLLSRPLNGIVFWTIVGGAVAGFPMLIALDPLSSFNRLTPLLRGWFDAAALVPGLLVPAFLLLSAIQPAIWCTHFCPMGYLFKLVHVRASKPVTRHDATRRDIVFGLLIGVPLGLFARKLRLVPSARASESPILPPGAKTPADFAARCSRCYACVNACPTQVLRVRAPAGRALGAWFHPELDTSRSYCEESCNLCSKVCPAGAIVSLTLEQKRHRKIGAAHIIREACLAWADREYCTVCDEYCPYHAIEVKETRDGIPLPKVNPEVCRGCGACQANCPAKRAGRAIVVRGVQEQGVAKDVE